MTKQKPNTILDAAKHYLQRGWAPIPVPEKSKAPTIKRWTKLRLTEEEVDKHFSEPCNIGILLGEPSGGLVDVDIDSEDALDLAAELLPNTDAVFGRASRLKSHYLYVCDPAPNKTAKFTDETGDSIVEIRSTGGQTIFPPSIHTSGEQIAWAKDGEPGEPPSSELLDTVRLVAVGTILSRHYPTVGSRHDFSLAVASVLLRAGYAPDAAESFLLILATHNGDEEAAERARGVESTQARLDEGATAHGLPFLSDLIGNDAAKAMARILGLKQNTKSQDTQRDRVYRDIRDKLRLWHTDDDRTFASVEVDGHTEHYRIGSRSFRFLVRRAATTTEDKLVGKAAIDEAIDYLDLSALKGPQYDAHIRAAEYEGCIYIDLVDDRWRAVEITDQDWSVIDNPPVRFVRSRGMQPIPEPERGGLLDDLRPFVNVQDDDNFMLLIGIIISALRGSGPYPIGIINGEQGSAKSTLVRIIRSLIDPNKASTRASPKNEEDIYVAASNSYMLSFDNVSYISGKMSDALCRLATGGGFSKRELYTDLDEIIVEVCRPVLLNGIPDLVNRGDLMDRAIVLTLPQIPPKERRTERELWPNFTAATPKILGSLFDAVSAGLRCRDGVDIEEPPRMADLAEFMTAVEIGLELEVGRFTNLLLDHQRKALIDLATGSALAELIATIAYRDTFEGTATALMDVIVAEISSKGPWPPGVPRAPNRLVGALRRLLPALREMNIVVDLDYSRDKGNRKLIRIYNDTDEEEF